MTDTVLLSSSASSTGNSSRSSNTSVPTTNMDDTTTKKVVEDTDNNNNNKNHTKSSFQRQETQSDSDHKNDNNENDLIKNDKSIVTNAPDSNQTMNGQKPIDIDDDDDHNDNDENENSKDMMNDNVVVVDHEQQIEEIEEEEDDDDVIDDEQVNEFKEQLQSLGNYPDKVMINTLSMIATDYQDSFTSVQKLYSTWKLCLLQKHTSPQKIHEMMPIIYVLDSILKNVPGKLFRTMVEKDYTSWLPLTYLSLPTIQQQKLYKVYVTWKEYNIFTSIDKWKEIGTSFLHSSTTGVGSTNSSTNSTTNMVTTRETNSDMIIPRNQKDGTLILAKNLRQEMQNILDDIQQQQQQQEHDGSNNDNGSDELNKISLERLADINPTLLYNIKKAAEDGLKLAASSSMSSSTLQQQPTSTSMMMHRDSKHTVTATSSSSLLLNKRNNATNTNTTNNNNTSITPSFIIETRTMDTVQRSNEWYTVLLQQQPSTHTLSNGGSSSTHHNTTTPSSSTSTATDALVNSITKSIEQMIHNGCCTETEQEHTNHDTKLYTQKDAVLMTKYYATGSAISQLLVLSLQQQQQSVNHQTNAIGSAHSTTTTTTSANHRTATNHRNDNISSSSSSSLIYTTNFFKVNQINIDDFTTEGIKPKKAITISLLYEIGLPYQSTIDGKRFRTEQQLSKHLDYIFQQKVLSSSSSLLNTTTTSKERGWYIHDQIWTKEMEEIQHDPVSSMTSNPNLDATNQLLMDVTMTTTDPDQLYTVVADESRDTCVICGRRFIMYFDDSQEGQYKYRNCISIPMKGQNDNDDDDDLDHDVGLDEDDDNDDDHNTNGTNKTLQPQLIHGTCWIGLGQPDTISYDQTIYINKEQ